MESSNLSPLLPESNGGRKNKFRQLTISVIVFLVAGIFLYLVLKDLNWASFWIIIRNGNYAIILFLIPITSFNFFLRALRWRILVQSQGNISVIPVFWANMIGYLGNLYLPARAGEFMRSAYLGKKSGAGTSFVLATALTERILDALALVLMGSLSLAFQIEVAGPILTAVRTMAVISIIGFGVIFITPFFEAHLVYLLNAVPILVRIRGKLIQQFQRFLLGMRSLQNWRRLTQFSIFTAAIWLIDGFGTVVGVRIIGQALNLGQALILLAALGLSSAIPSTPGYIGVYQFVAVTVLVPFGFTKPDALAYILISQLLGYLVITFWGLIGLSRIRFRRDTDFLSSGE